MSMSDITEVSTELKPCPFCGGKALIVPVGAWNLCRAGYCTDCEVYGPSRSNEDAAIEAWNLRTLSPAAQGRKPPGPLESPSAGLSPDEYRLRKMLAFSYSGSNLYGDDGELQDSAYPFPIDYMRDSVEQIETAIHNRGMAALAKHQAALSTDTTEQPRSVQRRIAAQNGLPAPDFSAPPLDAQKADTTQARDAWVPVSEQPPPMKRCLMWWVPVTPNKYAECPVVGQRSPYNDKDELAPEHEVWYWANGRCYGAQFITHWQPLPAAPAAIAKETTK